MKSFEPMYSRGLAPSGLETSWVKPAPRHLCYSGQAGAAGREQRFNSMTDGETEVSLLLCRPYCIWLG